MTQQEYEKARQECRDALYDELFKGEVQWQPVSRYDVFCAAFDRAYALGKQEGPSKNSSESNPAEPTENKADEIVASMIGSDDCTTWRGGSNKEIWHNMAKSSLEIADALIAECDKEGGEE